MKLTAEYKKWITMIAMAILAASVITSPIDLKGMLPAFVISPLIGGLNMVNIAAFAVLIGIYWIFKKEI